MFKAIKNEFLVPFRKEFKIKNVSTTPPQSAPGDKKCKKELKNLSKSLQELQAKLYSEDKYSILLVFQAMDAAGKDSTIKSVMRGVNPAGCQVFSFKKPSEKELDHDFLWRTSKSLPERGRIGIFNRSYYEEVLVVKVHPEYLNYQKLPGLNVNDKFWQERYQSINDHEKHLARNGTVILKFWLNVSQEEQKRRFISRINEPEKNWKFSSKDIEESKLWDEYMNAYEAALNATSKSWAPWYSIPADNKPFMRYSVSKIIVETMESLNLEYPTLDKKEKAKFEEMRSFLENKH